MALARAAVVTIAVILIASASLAFASDAPDVIKLKKDVEIARDMTVNDVIVVDGTVTVYGRIEANLVVIGGAAILKPGSEVKGHIVVVGELTKDPAAVIGGKITQVFMPRFIPILTTFMKGGWIALWATISILVLLGFLGLALLLIALIPDHMRAIVGAMDKAFFMMLLWGALSMLLIAPAAILLAISIVGIVLIPLEILLVALAFLIGYIACGVFIGDKIFLSSKKEPIPFVSAILGILILFLIGFIPVVGLVVKGLFLLAGFGAVVKTRFGTASA